MLRRLFNADPAPANDPGTGPGPLPSNPGQGQPKPQDPAPAPGPIQAPPPATKTVLTGTKTEEQLALERDLEKERVGRRKAEERAASLEDENHQLKTLAKPGAVQEKGMWEQFGIE